jgi:hypothetical protein
MHTPPEYRDDILRITKGYYVKQSRFRQGERITCIKQTTDSRDNTHIRVSYNWESNRISAKNTGITKFAAIN